MDPIAAKYIGAGIACIGMGGAGVGVGTIFGNYLAGALRNPSAAARPVRQPDLRLRGDRSARHLLAADRAAAAVRALTTVERQQRRRMTSGAAMARRPQRTQVDRARAGQRAWPGFPAVRQGDLRLAAALARVALRPALRADGARWRCRGSARSSRSGATASTTISPRRSASRASRTPPSRPTRRRWPMRAPRAGDRHRDARTAGRGAEASRKALEAELNAKLAEAEKTIAATKTAAMANVRGIAAEAARARSSSG